MPDIDTPEFFKSKGLVTTKRGSWDIEYGGKVIPTSEIPCDPVLFAGMCKTGCKNYGNVHSCPPSSPGFDQLALKYDYFCYYYVLMKLDQLPQDNCLPKIWTANLICRSRLEKSLRRIEAHYPNSKLLVSSSCRLCRKCTKPAGKPCSKPERMRINLGATGVNVSELLKKCFGFPLDWVWGDGEFSYSIVSGGLLTNEKILPVITIDSKAGR
jgi:predicted metal-binding protein